MSFIVIEGLDGSGKSTQVRMLRERLGRHLYLHFPRVGDPWHGLPIARFLRGDYGPADAVDPWLVAMLFAADRHGAAPELRRALDAGDTVLADRYVFSNIAYQCAKVADGGERRRLRDWIYTLEYERNGIPRPDLCLWLDAPLAFVEARLSEDRGQDGDRSYLAGARDVHEADIRFQAQVAAQYRDCSRQYPELRRVACQADDGAMLPPHDIQARITAQIEQANLL